MRLTFAIQLILLGFASGAEYTPTQYKDAKYAHDAIDTIAFSRMAVQRVTKEFYFFLFDVEPEANADKVRKHMKELEEGFANFSHLIKMFTHDFDTPLDTLNNSIQEYYKSIAAFSDVFAFETTTTQTSTTNTLPTTTVTTTTTLLQMTVLRPVEGWCQSVSDQLSDLWKQVTEWCWMKNVYKRLYMYDFIDRKRMLSQEMGKFAVLRALGRNMPLGFSQDLATHALFALLKTMDSFSEGLQTFLEGSPWIGNAMVPDVCFLASTALITYQYEDKVLPDLRRVIYRLKLTEEDWEYMDKMMLLLLKDIEDNYPLIYVIEGKPCPSGECEGRWNRGAIDCPQVRADIDSNGWLNAISMLNNNRRVLQELTRIYLQVVKGYQVQNRIDRLQLRRDEFLYRMNRLTQGYKKENVPSPPTQDLSEALQLLLTRNWRPFDEIFLQAIQGKSKQFDGRLEGADNTTLILLDNRCTILANEFLQISSLYIRECPAALRQRCFLVEAAYGQAAAYERLVKEAWFCSLFENSTAYLQRFNYTKDNLTAATLGLVDGVAITDETIQEEHAFWSYKLRIHLARFAADPETAASLTIFEPLTKQQINETDYNTFYETMAYKYKYADLFIFDNLGKLVYSVKKKSDWQTNFLDGKYADTYLARTYQAALERPKEIHESYWAHYPPNGEKDAAFVCTGILDDETYVGVICLQLPSEDGIALPRAESYCILNELYLARRAEKNLIEVLESVVYPKNWTDSELARFTNAYFNDLFPKFSAAVILFSQIHPQCAQKNWLEFPTIEQWRTSMTAASILPSTLPMVAKQYFVAQKMQDFEVRSSILYSKKLKEELATTSLTLGSDRLRDLTLGTLDGRMTAAPSARVVETGMNALDSWNTFKAAMQAVYKEEDVIPTGNIVYDAMIVFRTVMTAFTTYARRSSHSIEDLQPGLMALTGDPGVFTQQMAMEASMLSLWQGSPQNLSRTVGDFEEAISVLRSDSRATAERCRVQALSRLLDTWTNAKPKVQQFGIKFTYTEEQLGEMMNVTGGLFNDAVYMQEMFEDISPTCVLNDSESVRACAGVVSFLSGLFMLLWLREY